MKWSSSRSSLNPRAFKDLTGELLIDVTCAVYSTPGKVTPRCLFPCPVHTTVCLISKLTMTAHQSNLTTIKWCLTAQLVFNEVLRHWIEEIVANSTYGTSDEGEVLNVPRRSDQRWILRFVVTCHGAIVPCTMRWDKVPQAYVYINAKTDVTGWEKFGYYPFRQLCVGREVLASIRAEGNQYSTVKSRV